MTDSTVAELLDRVLAADEADDAPRLALAEALIRAGDPRGEFIVAQVQVARLKSGDPASTALWIRANALEMANRDAWGRCCYEALGGGLQFVRGFARAIDAPSRATELAALVPLFATEPIRVVKARYSIAWLAPMLGRVRELVLTVASDRVLTLADLLGDAVFPGIETLEVQGPLIAADLAFLTTGRALPRLRTLRLNRCGLTADALAPWCAAPAWLAQIRALDLANNALDDAAVARLVLEALTHDTLEELALGMNAVTDAGVRALAASPHLHALRRLALGDSYLTNDFAPRPGDAWRLVPDCVSTPKSLPAMFQPPPVNPITAAGVAALGDAVARLPALRELDLWALRIGPEGAAALVASPLFSQLRALNLRATALGARGAATLLAAPTLGALDGIDLTDATVPLHGLEVYAAIPAMARAVRTLTFTDATAEQGPVLCAAIAACTGLESLSLSALDPSIAPGLPAAIAMLPRLHTLRVRVAFDAAGLPALLDALAGSALHTLDLTVTPGDPALLERLAAWPALARVTSLALRGPIGDAGLAAFVRSPYLGALDDLFLWSQELTDVGLAALVATPLPSLRSLNLASNRIGDAGARALVEAHAWPALRKLGLAENNLGIDGVRTLASGLATAFPGLTSLALVGNPFGLGWDAWTDWDGTVLGGAPSLTPDASAALAAFPRSIELQINR